MAWCPECGLSQLEQIVDPKVLYANYPFRAGASAKWQSHCAMLMTSLEKPGKKFLIDIGSNDGTLLQEAQDRGWRVLGVDPSPTDTAMPSLTGVWSSGMAARIARLHGQTDVVTATNVFGHVDDALDFLQGVALILKPRGVAIIECPHIFPLLEHVAFDTIYHEHLSYWSLRPLEMLAERVGLKVIDVRMYSDLHGGTMRYILASEGKVKTSVTGLRILESAHFQQGLKPYQEFAQKTEGKLTAFRGVLIEANGKCLWGYGANAKAAVLLQSIGADAIRIHQIVDDTEAKWGFRTPGNHIPIIPVMDMDIPDILVLLSWNNAPELKTKARIAGFKGRFFLPHPTPHFEDI